MKNLFIRNLPFPFQQSPFPKEDSAAREKFNKSLKSAGNFNGHLALSRRSLGFFPKEEELGFPAWGFPRRFGNKGQDTGILTWIFSHSGLGPPRYSRYSAIRKTLFSLRVFVTL